MGGFNTLGVFVVCVFALGFGSAALHGQAATASGGVPPAEPDGPAAGTADASGPAYTHAPTGIAFPRAIAGFEYQGVTGYEARRPGLGHGVRYERGGPGTFIKADIYLYDKQREDLGTGKDALAAEEMMQAILEVNLMAERGYYRDVSLGKDMSGSWDGGDQGKLPFAGFRLSFAALMEDGGEPVPRESLIILTTYDGYFLKFRITWLASLKNGQQQANAFLKAMVGELFPLPR